MVNKRVKTGLNIDSHELKGSNCVVPTAFLSSSSLSCVKGLLCGTQSLGKPKFKLIEQYVGAEEWLKLSQPVRNQLQRAETALHLHYSNQFNESSEFPFYYLLSNAAFQMIAEDEMTKDFAFKPNKSLFHFHFKILLYFYISCPTFPPSQIYSRVHYSEIVQFFGVKHSTARMAFKQMVMNDYLHRCAPGRCQITDKGYKFVKRIFAKYLKLRDQASLFRTAEKEPLPDPKWIERAKNKEINKVR